MSIVVKDANGVNQTVETLPAKGQATAANSLPMVLATDQPAVPVAGPLTDGQLRASAVPVTGPLTDTQLRASAVPVTGALTDTQLRASAVPVSNTGIGAPGDAKATSATDATTSLVSQARLHSDQGAQALAAITATTSYQTSVLNYFGTTGVKLAASTNLIGGATLYVGSNPVSDTSPVITRQVTSQTGTVTPVPASVTAVSIAPANTGRNAVIFFNSSSYDATVCYGGGSADSNTSFVFKANKTYVFEGRIWCGAFSAKWAAASGTMYVTEVTV
jgi:hypothetical protein